MPDIDNPPNEEPETPAGDDLIAAQMVGGEAASESVPAEPVPVSAAEDTKHWYIIHTYSGFERKVAESLRTRAEAFGFSEQIGQILIPEEEVVELRNGKKVTSKR